MIGIVASRADEASEHVADVLLDATDWTRVDDDHYRTDGFELRFYDDLHIHLDGVAADFDDPDFLAFVSRHAGETAELLSAHFTGNFGTAEYGGADRSLAPACPNAQREVLRRLAAHAPPEYEVGLECTHHGPTDPGAPAMFVELGSGEAQWRDPAGAEAVARAVLDLRGVDPRTDRAIVAFGGGHYAPRPTRIVRETDWACGHVAADWCLDDLGAPDHHRDVVDRAFAASGARHALVDGDRPDLVDVIEALGYRVVTETWVRETTGVPVDLAEALEADLATVDDGLRFGDHVTDAYEVVDLPDDLLADAAGVDMNDVVTAARETAVAYETDENGNRVAGRAAFPARDAYDDFVDRICRVLDREYDAVERDDGDVVVHESAFDPEKAATLGVPEGPKFGKLAAGTPVEVDGRTIDPDVVTTDRTRRYAV